MRRSPVPLRMATRISGLRLIRPRAPCTTPQVMPDNHLVHTFRFVKLQLPD